MKTEDIKIEDLKPSEYNPRDLTEKEKKDLTESIKRFGMVEPIVVNSAPKRKNVIIGGHQRFYICRELGRKTIPAVYVNIPELKKERELNLRLNKNIGHWDFEMLANFDEGELLDVGWESKELDDIFGLATVEDDFKVQAEYEKIRTPKTKRGELYQLDKHRLVCGDSTKKEDVGKLMGEKKADMVFTDPPYNVAYEGTKFDKIKGDEQTEEDFIKFSEEFIARMAEATKKGGVFYICSGYSSFPTFLWALRKNRFQFSTPIIWVKNNTSLGWGDYRHKHEMVIKTKNPPKKKKAQPILYGWKKGEHYFVETRFEADVWEIKRRASNTMSHPTQNH